MSASHQATSVLVAGAACAHDCRLRGARWRYRGAVACVRPTPTPNPDAMKFTLDISLPERLMADRGDDSEDAFTPRCWRSRVWPRCSVSTIS